MPNHTKHNVISGIFPMFTPYYIYSKQYGYTYYLIIIYMYSGQYRNAYCRQYVLLAILQSLYLIIYIYVLSAIRQYILPAIRMARYRLIPTFYVAFQIIGKYLLFIN